jgi:hypothetical protein
LRRLHGQSGSFEFGERGLECAVHAAEKLDQPPGPSWAKAGSQGESKPENLVRIRFGHRKVWVGGNYGNRQKALLGRTTARNNADTKHQRKTVSRSPVTLRTVF